MSFDLARIARTLHAHHADPARWRFAMLDLLFAVGCGAREQVVALDSGDAMCLRTSGPPAPDARPRLAVVAIDLDLPRTAGEPHGAWPPGLRALGGPAAGIGWLAALQALLADGSQRPWELLMVRGPAAGTADFVADLFAELGAGDVAVVVPACAAPADSLDWVRVDLARPRNIWRFPACDHTVTVAGTASFGAAWPALREVIAGLGPGAAWTLHNLRVAAGEGAPFRATLRASVAPGATAAVAVTPIDGEARLLFPVNDALSAAAALGERLPAGWADALSRPVAAAARPDGLSLEAVVPTATGPVDLPDRSGGLTCDWASAPLLRPWRGRSRRLAVAADEAASAVAAGVPAAAEIWFVPAEMGASDLAGVARGVAAAVRAGA